MKNDNENHKIKRSTSTLSNQDKKNNNNYSKSSNINDKEKLRDVYNSKFQIDKNITNIQFNENENKNKIDKTRCKEVKLPPATISPSVTNSPSKLVTNSPSKLSNKYKDSIISNNADNN